MSVRRLSDWVNLAAKKAASFPFTRYNSLQNIPKCLPHFS